MSTQDKTKHMPSREKRCSECKEIKDLALFGKEKRKPDGRKSFCLGCAPIIHKRYYRSATCLASTLSWRKRYPERHLQYVREYRQRMKRKLVDGYGGKCTCCGESEIAFLTLEHLNRDGHLHRKIIKNCYAIYKIVIERGFPPEYTVLCMNCNFAKRGTGICPHQMRN